MKVSWDYSSQYMEKYKMVQTTNQMRFNGKNSYWRRLIFFGSVILIPPFKKIPPNATFPKKNVEYVDSSFRWRIILYMWSYIYMHIYIQYIYICNMPIIETNGFLNNRDSYVPSPWAAGCSHRLEFRSLWVLLQFLWRPLVFWACFPGTSKPILFSIKVIRIMF